MRTPTDQLIYLSKNGYRDLLVIHPLDSLSTKAELVDLNIFIQSRFDMLIGRVDEEQQYSWRAIDESENIVFDGVLADTDSYFSFPFPAPLSGWQIDLQVNPRAFLPTLFESGKGLYALIFALLAIWLILGLIFTVYMLNQEIRLSRMKTHFISNVSHEFKSPVTSIRHMSELLKLKRVRTDEKKEEFYDSMIDQCDHLGHLIENIMDFSKIEDEIKKYHFETINPTELIENMVNIHRNRISESGMELGFSATGDTQEIKADKDALQQVIYNLLDNAYKYGADGMKISVSLEGRGQNTEDISKIKDLSDKDQEGEIVLKVRDWGKGIPKQELPMIFDRFYRGDKKYTEGIKGSGIGLTIVKRIVEAHGGRIEVESTEGKGSVFTVILPAINQEL